MASTTESGTGAHGARQEVLQTRNNLRDRDEFFKETYRFFDALGKHRLAVAVVAALLIAAAVAGGILANRRAARAVAGRSALFLAQKAYETELKLAAGVKTPAQPSDPGTKRLEAVSYEKLDLDAKFPVAVKAYRGIIARFHGDRSSHEAEMALGGLYFDHGAPDKAAPLFLAATEDAAVPFEKALSLESLGYAQENNGQAGEALATYTKALGLADGGLKGDLWLAVARCLIATHDPAKARSTYEKILTELPNTDAAKAAEAYKTRL